MRNIAEKNIDNNEQSGFCGHVISICDLFHPERRKVEEFLEINYFRAFGGKLHSHYPILMSVRNKEGEILAASGFRYAEDERLFLENYLGDDVEVTLQKHFANLSHENIISRKDIVEIGNLVSSDNDKARGVAYFLFRAMATYLKSQNKKIACATATRPLRRIFRVVNFKTETLAKASIDMVENPEDWGSYYENDPQVIAGLIDECSAPLETLKLPSLYARIHHKSDN